jgi:hypothetical protein
MKLSLELLNLSRWIVGVVIFLFAIPAIGTIPMPNGTDNSGIGFQDKIAQHSDTCPKSCKPCDQITEKALKFIATRQDNEGYWIPSLKNNLTGKEQPPKHGNWQPIALTITCLNGLALYASGSTTKEGPFQKNVLLAKSGIKKLISYVHSNFRNDPHTSEAHHALPYVAFFLAHLSRQDNDQDAKTMLEGYTKWILSVQDKEGGWSYKSYSQVFATNSAILSLLLIRNAGYKVDDKVFTKAKEVYTSKDPKICQNEDGSFMYGFDNKKYGVFPVNVGRTAEALWPMKLIGLADSATYKKAAEYTRKNLEHLDKAQHGPSYHLFYGGLGCLYMNEDPLTWAAFWKTFRDTIVQAQKDDGSILAAAKKDAFQPIDEYMGPFYTTPKYAILLQLHKGHLQFDKIK